MSTTNTNGTENMTIEQLTAIFGADTAAIMFAQMNAGSGTGGAPYSFLKKISVHGSELGNFGEFVYGTKSEKDAEGNRVVTEKGTNVGKDFEFILVNVSYIYTLWDEAKAKGLRSNIFTTLDGIKTAVDGYTGTALPASKEAKKAAGWKLNRINAGLVRANSKAKWEPVIWETVGAMYFTLGEVVGKQANGGLLSGTVKVVTKLESKGSTQYPVIDTKESSFGPLPKDFFTPGGELAATIGEITTDMTAYQKASQYEGATSTPPKADTEEGTTDW